ncbi:MAG: methyltransferase domain-containing protein [Candidatus Sericytochromatia bacterium]|nr:methyltransferase domain-containing protein [Candidatus Tanganyikabacteria bacterium]
MIATRTTGQIWLTSKVLATFDENRRQVAERYLCGEGIEIGALHLPLEVGPDARVRYVDRCDEQTLRGQYPELADMDLAPVDVVDDGEVLATFAPESLDFIIANHFLEHCENPLGTLRVHLSRLMPGGVIYAALPDKRFTFDRSRPLTPFEHLAADDRDGPEGSRAAHYLEVASLQLELADQDAERKAAEMADAAYSIHFHVWDAAAYLEFLARARSYLAEAFEVAHFQRNGVENIAILKKPDED